MKLTSRVLRYTFSLCHMICGLCIHLQLVGAVSRLQSQIICGLGCRCYHGCQEFRCTVCRSIIKGSFTMLQELHRSVVNHLCQSQRTICPFHRCKSLKLSRSNEFRDFVYTRIHVLFHSTIFCLNSIEYEICQSYKSDNIDRHT